MATRNEQQQTIRQSCNCCAQQKVRCSKERPRCTRCKNKGLECEYSYSRRTGRRSASSISKTHESSRDISNLPAAVLEDASYFEESSFNGGPDFGSYGAPLVPFDFSWSPANEGSDISVTSPDISPSVNGQGFPQNLSLPSVWSDWQNFQPSTTGTTPPTPPPSIPLQKHSVRQAASVHASGRGCMAVALDLVSSLHVSRESCVRDINAPINVTVRAEDTRDVDQVLFENRDAIKAVHQILDCSCSRDNSVFMACHLVASNIVAWYQAALGLSEKQYANGDDAAFADRVVARPIFMGNYLLDAAASRSVRAGLILSELKEHMQPLLLRLGAHLPGTGLPGGGFDLACSLRDQLRGTVEEASLISLGTV